VNGQPRRTITWQGSSSLLRVAGAGEGSADPAGSELPELPGLLAQVRDGTIGTDRAVRLLQRSFELELTRNLSCLSRGIIHDLNNIRAGLFSNLDHITEMLAIWERIHPLLQRLVRASSLVPELRRFADDIRGVDEEEDLSTMVEDTPELLADLAETRLRTQRLVERLELVSGRNKGLLVEEDLEQAICRVVADVSQGRVDLPRIEVQADRSILLFTYRQLLERCIGELLLNAIEAAGREGTVSIATLPSGEEVFISIQDDGPGMSSEVLEQSLLPFFSTRSQGGPTAARRGLGLNVALRAALQMGGDLRISSRPGEGTLVTLRLPAPSCQGKTVLLLGDPEGEVAGALPGARLVVVRSAEDLRAAQLQPPPALAVLAASFQPELALELIERLDVLAPKLPLVRHGTPHPSEARAGIDEMLEHRIWAEAEDAEFLDHEVRRILCCRSLEE